MLKVEHIGIAVNDIDQSKALFSKLFNSEPYKEEVVETEQVKTSFFKIGDTKIELLEAIEESSPINIFIQKKGEGVHHIAYEVEDLEKEMERLRREGFQLLSEKPKKGADNKIICFLHPKSTNGVLIELCQEIK